MVIPVRVVEGMQRVIPVHKELSAGNKNGPGGPQREITLSVSHSSRSYSRSSVIPCSGSHNHRKRQAQLPGDFAFDRSYLLIALIQLGQLFPRYAAQLHHFF